MDIQIKIGREVDGPSDISVPAKCKKVGRKHATLLWHDGVVIIEDNESRNGTFVNGKRIAKTKVREDDIVWLGERGEEEGYQLDLKKMYEWFRKMEKNNRTDYSEEFEDIKRAYIAYQSEVDELKKKITVKSQLPIRILSFLPALVATVIILLPNKSPNIITIRITVMSVGASITGIINLLMIGKTGNASSRLVEETEDLRIKYQPRYCCPKCGMKYPFTTHWKKLRADGCPNPKCNAVFMKK